ncbi:hypothetical protein ACIA5C_44960 [Actinoplanes sp. NPDC051343]|uniref:hypothetical protein n=1 Tax=Actinoplanes sp. NPDC051343 TaxID=3363906 RepID=UPI0037B7FF1E
MMADQQEADRRLAALLGDTVLRLSTPVKVEPRAGAEGITSRSGLWPYLGRLIRPGRPLVDDRRRLPETDLGRIAATLSNLLVDLPLETAWAAVTTVSGRPNGASTPAGRPSEPVVEPIAPGPSPAAAMAISPSDRASRFVPLPDRIIVQAADYAWQKIQSDRYLLSAYGNGMMPAAEKLINVGHKIRAAHDGPGPARTAGAVRDNSRGIGGGSLADVAELQSPTSAGHRPPSSTAASGRTTPATVSRSASPAQSSAMLTERGR